MIETQNTMANYFNMKDFAKAYDTYFPPIETLGNFAVKDFRQFIFAYRQVNAAGYLTSHELRQFSEAGVSLLDLLAKTLNKTQDEIAQLVTDGKVTFSDVKKALSN